MELSSASHGLRTYVSVTMPLLVSPWTRLVLASLVIPDSRQSANATAPKPQPSTS